VELLVKLLVAIFGKLLADDLKAWFPRLTELLINRAVRQLPCDLQERYAEEWRAFVAEIPGEMGKLLCAFGFLWAGWRLSTELRIKTVGISTSSINQQNVRNIVLPEVQAKVAKPSVTQAYLSSSVVIPVDEDSFLGACPKCGRRVGCFDPTSDANGHYSHLLKYLNPNTSVEIRCAIDGDFVVKVKDLDFFTDVVLGLDGNAQ
jgi:hypothetical protein